MKKYLKILADGKSLTQTQAEGAMHILFKGECAPEETAALLMGLRTRGETLDELTGFVKVMRAYAVPVDRTDRDTIDIVGTGGDQSGTFNISTAAAIVCAGAGITVAKHGNRSVSSKCGSAEVLEALGVQTHLGKPGVEFCLDKAGLAFMFAPYFHPAMRFVMPVRRVLKVRSFFNILGPMCNPAGVDRYLVGAFNDEVAQLMIGILTRLGARHALTVHAKDGLDEFSLAADTLVHEDGTDTACKNFVVRPEDLGFDRVDLRALKGGDAEENAAIIQGILNGKKGPQRDVVLMNAAYGLYVSGKYDSLSDCLTAVQDSLDNGKAKTKLKNLVEASQEAPPLT